MGVFPEAVAALMSRRDGQLGYRQYSPGSHHESACRNAQEWGLPANRLAPDLPLVKGDRVQLQQVMLNFILNAVEALSGTREGSRELLISTVKAEPDGVLVAVLDSGTGLALSNLERLFEAFYTIKPGGLGTGLSICRSIIEAHGDGCGPRQTNRRAPSFGLRYPRNKSGHSR
jgi:signal transduction histidine kinase